MKLTEKEHFDLENKLCEIEERSKEKYMKEQERKIVEKALKQDKDNMTYLNRAFPYLTEQHLYDTITGLYPDLNEMFIVNLDERDGSNIPLVKTKNFRPLRVSHVKTTYKNGYYSGQSNCHVDVNFKMVIAVIEDGSVYIKSANLQNGLYNKKFS